MLKNKKKKIFALIVIIISVACLLSIIAISKVGLDEEEANQINTELLQGYGTDDFTFLSFKDHVPESEIVNDYDYNLSFDNWHFNGQYNAGLKEKSEEIYKKTKEVLTSNDELIYDKNESYYENWEKVYKYKYKGTNLYMYDFELWELYYLISMDMVELQGDVSEMPMEEKMFYHYQAMLIASDILLDYCGDRYVEQEERLIYVVVKNNVIQNYPTIESNIHGLNSPRVMNDEETFVADAKEYAKEIYNKAIEDGRYDPENPFFAEYDSTKDVWTKKFF